MRSGWGSHSWLGDRAVGEAVEGVSGVVYKTVTIVTGKRR